MSLSVRVRLVRIIQSLSRSLDMTGNLPLEQTEDVADMDCFHNKDT